MLNFVHGNLYSTALELSRKFTTKNEIRPVLNYVHHTNDGRMEATDSHRAIMFHDIHGFEKDYLVHPKTFNVATGDFPELPKLFENTDYEHVVTLSKEQIMLWLQLFRSINNTLRTMKVGQRTDSNKPVHLHFKQDYVNVTLAGLDVSMKLPASVLKPGFEPIAVNAEFIRDTMEVFSKMETQEIDIRLCGALRPILFEDKGKIEILVLPIRGGYPIEEAEE